MSSFYDQLAGKLEQLRAKASLRQLPAVDHLDHGKAAYGGREIFNLSGNDYLGIAGNVAWREAFLSRGLHVELSAASSRLLTGNHSAYRALEEQLESVYGKCALVLNSGYHANSGVLPALAGKGDLILADKLVHASIIDGLRLGTADFVRYRHLDYEDLEERLQKAQGTYRNLFIVTESTFSMDGDKADLRKLAELKKAYNGILYVDEAHSVGCQGKNGLGACVAEGVLGEVDVLMGTLGKAFGSCGAFVIVPQVIREYLVNTMRPLIFTTGLAPINVAWTSYVLSRMPELESDRQRLQAMGERLRGIIRKHGFETLGETQIVPLMVGDNDKAVALAHQLQTAGILVFPIRPPTVPAGTARLRFSLSSTLPDACLNLIDRVLP